MSRYFDKSSRAGVRQAATQPGRMNGLHRHRPDGIRAFRENHRKRSGSKGRDEVNPHAERVVGEQLHFFPTSFALPRALFGIVTIIAVVLLIALLFFQVSSVIT